MRATDRGNLPLEPESHPLAPLIKVLAACHPLSVADAEQVLALPYQVKDYATSAYLVREGDRPACCAVLCSGYAYRQKLTGEGLRQILAIHLPGEPLDLQHMFLDVADHSLQMLAPGRVALIRREDLRQLIATNRAIAHAVMVKVLAEASIFREWVLNVGRRRARERLAHVLCEFAYRLEASGLAEPGGVDLPMTQEELADALGLTSVHVNRTLRALEGEGLIARSKRRIRFADWRALQAVGDFNPRYLHDARAMMPGR